MTSLEAEEGNSENREEDGFFQSDGGRNGPDESSGTRSPTQTADDEEGSQAKEEEENCVQTAEEDAEIKVCGDLWSSGNIRFLKYRF